MTYVWTPNRLVFAYWSVAILVGFIATHFYQIEQINYLWGLISLTGLYLMYKYMFNKNKPLHLTFWVWLLVLGLGMIISVLSLYFMPLIFLSGYLGIFWLFLMGIGHILTAITFTRQDFYLTGLIQIIVGILCLFILPLSVYQYVVAGLVGSLSMVRFLK